MLCQITRPLKAFSTSLKTSSSNQTLHSSAIVCKPKRQKPFKVPVDYTRYQTASDGSAFVSPRKASPGARDYQVRLDRDGRPALDDRESSDPRAGNGFGMGKSWLGRSADGQAVEDAAVEKSEPEEAVRTSWLDRPVRMGQAKPEPFPVPPPFVPPGRRAPINYGEFKPAYTDPALRRFANSPQSKEDSGPWMPTKKLTHSAMAGLKALHQADPDKYSREELSDKFGISYESVKRITRSKYREKGEEGLEAISGTKWDLSAESGDQLSPVPALKRAFELAGVGSGIQKEEKEVEKRRTFGERAGGTGGESNIPSWRSNNEDGNCPSSSRQSFRSTESQSEYQTPASRSTGPKSFGLRKPLSSEPRPSESTSTTSDYSSSYNTYGSAGDYRPRTIKPKTLEEISQMVPQAPTVAQAALSPFNGPRGLRSAIKHMLRSDAKREIEMVDVVRGLSDRERRLAEEVEREREEAFNADRKGMKRKKAKNLRLASEGVYL